MSSLSIPRPKKLSDGQFIGDLTKLLERRKIKCGDPLSLESFGSELTSNTILRSDLFTLCTAISHMGEEDLSGEQLLVLVGRAVGGTKVCRGDGAVEIPDSMRSAFLSGFEAWGKRGSELNDPLPWPPPRPQLARSESLPEVDDFTARPESLASKAPASGLHSIQEALEIAKKRSPTGLAQPPRSAAAGTNVDGLTISELKTLLEDIEHRMSRIQPHLSQLNSIVDSAAGDFRRSKGGSEPEDVIPIKAASAKAGSTPLPTGRPSPSLAGSLAAVAGSETISRRSPVIDVTEDAFLARHPYLKPSKRSVPDLPIAVLPVTPVDETPAAAVAPVVMPPVIPQDPVASMPAAVALAAPIDLPAPALVAPPVAAAAVVAPVTGAPPTPAVVPQAARALLPAPAVAPGTGATPVTGLNPIGAALVYILEGLRANPRLIFALAAVLLLVPAGFAGLFVYDYLHPKTVIRYPDPKPAAAIQTPDLAGDPLAGVASATPDAAADSQPRPVATGPHGITRPQSPIAHNGASRDTTRQAAPVSKPQSQAYVWPPPPDRTEETPAPPRPLVAAATSTLPASSAPRPSHLTGPPPSAIYVPSSTMIKYAVSTPKPVYPMNQANRMDGTVVVQITVSKQGDVTSARPISGPVEFRSAAVQAVRAWRFRPYLLSGNPADVETMLEVPFKPE